MALISFAVTPKLICVFVCAYAKSRFSYYAAQLLKVSIIMDGTFEGGYLVITDRSFLSVIHTNTPYGYSSVRCFYSNKYQQVTSRINKVRI